MKNHALRVVAVLTALGLSMVACSSSSDAPAAVSCTQPLSAFCGTDASVCAHGGDPTVPTHLSPTDVGTSTCTACGNTCSFEIETCPDQTVDIVVQIGASGNTGTQLLHYKYSAEELELVSVVESTSGVPGYQSTTTCLAGPSTISSPAACSDNSFWDCTVGG